MIDNTPVQTGYNMAPSTTLTPTTWRHVSIHPDAARRFKLCGYAIPRIWTPGDLKALKVEVKGGKVWGLTKERALEIGLQIENAMRVQNGQPKVAAPGNATPATEPQEQPVAAQEPATEPAMPTAPTPEPPPVVLQTRRIPKQGKPKPPAQPDLL